YEEYIYRKNEKYPFYWDEWVRKAEAKPVPGAVAFMDSVRSLGKFAHIVFITNRDTSQEAATIANLKKYGMWKEGDVMLCRRNKKDVKESRRREVMNGTGRCEGLGKRTIIALFGDQLHDMVQYTKGTPPQQLKEKYYEANEWGTQWFVLPNPMYGPWRRGYK
ncbi:MAG: HAD family acid phosphatase, partial [Calditrichia bacterium]